MIEQLDPQRYLRSPQTDAPGTIALGFALVSAAQPGMPVSVQSASERMHHHVVELQSTWGAQWHVTGDMDPRPSDRRVDRAWAAVGARLSSLATLPGDMPQARIAGLLYERLFPDGLTFLTLPYDKEWAASEIILEQIANDPELLGELEALVGEFLLEELRQAHAEYGRVLGITAIKPEVEAPRVLEALRAARDSIAAYSLQLVAAAHADPSLADAVRVALYPIDRVRSGQARRRSRGGSETDAPVEEEPEQTPEEPALVEG